jgi:hypothetical protein
MAELITKTEFFNKLYTKEIEEFNALLNTLSEQYNEIGEIIIHVNEDLTTTSEGFVIGLIDELEAAGWYVQLGNEQYEDIEDENGEFDFNELYALILG